MFGWKMEETVPPGVSRAQKATEEARRTGRKWGSSGRADGDAEHSFQRHQASCFVSTRSHAPDPVCLAMQGVVR